MDELVKEVRALKRISVIAVVLLCVIVAELAIQTQMGKKSLKMYANAYGSTISDFESIAGPLLIKGDYKELLGASEKWLQKAPTDPYALFYRAMANYQLGNLEIARGQFEELSNLRPDWNSQTQAYIQKIKEKAGQ